MIIINIVAEQSPRLKRAAYVFIAANDNQATRVASVEKDLSHNAAVLVGVTRALSECPNGASIVVRTNSEHLTKGMTEWMPGWIARGWRNPAGKPVANRPLWEAAASTASDLDVDWVFVRNRSCPVIDDLRNQAFALLKSGGCP